MQEPLNSNVVFDYALIKLKEKVRKTQDFIKLNPYFSDFEQELAIFGYPA